VKNYSTTKIQNVTATLLLPGQKVTAYKDQLYEAIEAALNLTDGVLDKHITSIGEKNVSRKMNKLEFREHLDEISQKIRICLHHHTDSKLTSMKNFAATPKEHLLSTLQYVRDIKNDLQQGKNLQEVLDKLQISWLNGLLSGDQAKESVSRQVLHMFNNALSQAATAVHNKLPPSDVLTRLIPTEAITSITHSERVTSFTSMVLEQFHVYSARLHDLLQQVQFEWMPKVFPDLRNGPIEDVLNRATSTENNSYSDDSSTLDTSNEDCGDDGSS